ncbi:GNS1/SUR4 membrane protein [Mycena leptocephala]|nr:GNS1/SUR4 membrane protein [Mycena leptocephala]
MASFSEFVLLYLPLAPVAMKIPLSAPSTVFSALVAYLAAISGAQILMQSRPPLKLRRIIQAHNLLLCAVSLLLLVLMLDEIVPMVRRVGFLNAMCGGDAYTKNLELYYRINYALKYVELLDTLFLTLKKKPLRFLHVYHHSSTIVLCYVQLKSRSSLSWVAIAPNLFVHVLMYYYYYLAAAGFRPSWKEPLTRLQITQFVAVGLSSIWALATSYFSVHHEQCATPPVAVAVGTFVISSYFVLFVHFYFTTYIKRDAESRQLNSKHVAKSTHN